TTGHNFNNTRALRPKTARFSQGLFSAAFSLVGLTSLWGLLPFASLFQGTAAAQDQGTIWGDVKGRVLDSTTAQPIPGVVVKFERDRDGQRWLSDPTDASGQYKASIPIGNSGSEGLHARTLAFDYAESASDGTTYANQTLLLDFRVARRPTGIVS